MAGKADISAGKAFVEIYVKNSQLVKGLGQVRAQLSQLSDHAMRVGKALFGLGAAMSLPFVAGVKEAADFEHQMKMISTMLDNPQQFMGGFSDGIQSMAVEFGESTDTMAKALTELLGSAVAPGDAMGVLRQTVTAAKGGLTDTATATSALINVLNAFQVPASRASEVTDMLFQTVRFGVVSFDQLAEKVGAVTSTSYAAGISMDEMGASIATMTRNGLQADTAITALQNILSEFLKPSDEGKSVAASLGLQMNTATLKAQGLAGVMQTLSKATPEQLAKIFPDARGLRGILALRGDLKGFLGDVANMGSKGGAAATAFQTMTGGLWDSFNKTKQAVIALAVAVGNSLGPPLQKIGSYLLPTIQLMTDWATRNQRIIRLVALSAVGFLAAGAALIAFAVAIKAALFAMGAFAIFGSIAGLIGAVASALLGLISPLGATLAAWAAIAYVTMSIFGTWKYLADVGRNTTTAIAGYFAMLKDTVDKTFAGIRDAIAAGDMQAAWNVAVAGMKVVWLEGTNAMRTAWADVKWMVVQTMEEARFALAKTFLDMGFSLESSWVSAIASIKGVWLEFVGWLNTAIAPIENMLSDAMVTAIGKVKGFDAATIEALKKGSRNALDKTRASEAERITGDQDKTAADAKERLDKLEKDRTAAQAILNFDKRSEDAARMRGYDANLKARQAELETARQELDKAAADAKKKKDAAAIGTKPGDGSRDVVGPSASSMAKSTPASFSASTLAYMGGGGGAKDVARNQLQIANEQLKEARMLRKEAAMFEKAMNKMEGTIRAIGGLRP